MSEFEFTTRTNRTNRLEALEEYYNNATDENQFEETTITTINLKEIVLLTTNISINEDMNRTNVSTIGEIGKKEKRKTLFDNHRYFCLHYIF